MLVVTIKTGSGSTVRVARVIGDTRSAIRPPGLAMSIRTPFSSNPSGARYPLFGIRLCPMAGALVMPLRLMPGACCEL